MAIKIIGLGGIGSNLAEPLCKYLVALHRKEGNKKQESLVFIDGRSYKERHDARQVFHRLGNKAEVTVERLRVLYPSLMIEAKPEYVTRDNIFLFIQEGDTIFLGPDNHWIRLLVSRRCSQLKNALVICGGNKLTDGSVQIYRRIRGKNVTPPLTHLHPEIEHAPEHNPTDAGCEELAEEGREQIIPTNLMAAAHMLCAYWAVTQGKEDRTEGWFDIATGTARFVRRLEEGQRRAKTQKEV